MGGSRELDDAQQKFGLVFPPDLVALLRDRRPVEGHDWTDEVAIRRILAWPFEGLLFDVENSHLWWPEWGPRPTDSCDREEVLRSVVLRAPKLIPLISHRYLPEEPHEEGNPVFSVYQGTSSITVRIWRTILSESSLGSTIDLGPDQ
jgi:hypothetical protein